MKEPSTAGFFIHLILSVASLFQSLETS
jgi:hypothetical protein